MKTTIAVVIAFAAGAVVVIGIVAYLVSISYSG